MRIGVLARNARTISIAQKACGRTENAFPLQLSQYMTLDTLPLLAKLEELGIVMVIMDEDTEPQMAQMMVMALGIEPIYLTKNPKQSDAFPASCPVSCVLFGITSDVDDVPERQIAQYITKGAKFVDGSHGKWLTDQRSQLERLLAVNEQTTRQFTANVNRVRDRRDGYSK